MDVVDVRRSIRGCCQEVKHKRKVSLVVVKVEEKWKM